MCLFLISYFNYKHLVSFLDHPVHAPPGKEDPWACEFPPASNYIIKSKRGVFQLYANEEAVAEEKAIPYAYPDLDTFVTDMNKLCAMIADGPL